MEFGDILRQIRKERGLSQDELAAMLGTTKQVLSRYETKKRVPRLSVVADYAKKLGLPLSVLSGEEAEPRPPAGRPSAAAGAFPCSAQRHAVSRSTAPATARTSSASRTTCPATSR